ncbi:peptide chain release factor N(5)-glutamine methyltransferase [Patescibacteria group bacterium]|nr:peptide chain release factor N(5)-glutamine methyltransferase [Candidatus Falkowbacteria bacterium]MBU3906377.1 peptide chain release factor N(5)-glutamine methyltransferase [Patescibacteria group bacterium]MBU4015451.1 peptide chain release factor N(5)-glutamine methyltransferase [Patescibacteria group bacterium]MBU4026767.1 peptide chain release factor N(5)-glutamine methyltransferase [Patescibacteria group bacterium]MBU4072561.1 peptide chain release factor N(5)-glutamine methyltransferas
MAISQVLINAVEKLKQEKIPTPRLDAEILLSHILKKSREYIYTYPNYKLSKSIVARYALCVTRRIKGEPIAYITGHKEFYGLNFFVNKNVLVPRPETELMVDEALRAAHNPANALQNGAGAQRITLIDVGTGSGCIIISLAKLLKNKIRNPKSEIRYLATDISKPALAIAKKNAKLHHVDKQINPAPLGQSYNKNNVNDNKKLPQRCGVKFLHGNLLEPFLKLIKKPKFKIQNSKFIILANLPYLTPAQIKNSPSIQCEPKIALNAGHDGLKYYRELFKQIKKLNTLYVMRYALCEIDPRQTVMLKQLIKKILPKAKIQIKKDLSGLNRLAIINIPNSCLSR